MTDTGFGDRAKRAWFLLQSRRGDLGQGWLADEVGQRVGRTFTQGAASRWLRGSRPKELATISALAAVLEVDPGWLAFGPDSAAPGPEDFLGRYVPMPPDD